MNFRHLAKSLMTNHYHLLFRAGETGFASGMRLLNCGHARRMNRKHGRTGHLFRNHYSWRPVESDEHLLETIRYILLNPVRAGLCVRPEDWRWSSYRATADLELPPDFLALSDLLQIFGTTPAAARTAFLDMFK
jgi:putative transposase